MRESLEDVRNLKELLLFISVVYFYVLAIALYFHLPTFGFDRPAPFVIACIVFLIALAMEAVLAWWDKPRFALWILLWVAAYGIIGFFVAPAVFGPGILLYVYAEPLVIVFIGGFAYAYAHLFAGAMFPERRLEPKRLDEIVKTLPGWMSQADAIAKDFRFRTSDEARAFTVRVTKIADRLRHHPDLKTTGTVVTVRLTSKEERGVTIRDIREAKKIDEAAI